MMLIAICRMEVGDSRKVFDTISKTVRQPLLLLCGLLDIVMVASYSLGPTLCAHTLTDEAHVVAPSRRKQDKDDSLKDPSRAKPIRVDVNLVLLPVTITDLMNCPVTGLEKGNFKVLRVRSHKTSDTSQARICRFH
jgi:hypothetical protein